MKKLTLAGAAALTVLSVTGRAQALANGYEQCVCTYFIGDQNLSGDVFYRNLGWFNGSTWCGAAMSPLTWAFGMDPGDWGGGFGYFDCSASKPFGRTMNAITALLTAPVDPVDDFNWYAMANNPMIEWAGKWVINEVDELDGRCTHPSSPAFAYADGDRVELYVRANVSCKMAFFHGFTAVERAATLVHEARHVHGPTHYASSKDYAWGTGGAYEWEGKWLEQYITMGDPASTNTTMRCSARDRLKTILSKHFVIPTNMVPPAVSGC